jgi:hypothetical protein
MRVALSMFVLLSLQGCGLALGAHRHLSGAELPPSLPLLGAGLQEEEIVSLFGEPTSERTNGSRHELVWVETIRPYGCHAYFGPVPLEPEPRLTREVRVVLREGRLADADVMETPRFGSTTRRSLLAAAEEEMEI